MWERTKRLINSYLDDLIDRVNGPDRDIRELTRAELARLNEVEAQARGAAKSLEKELAEVELKILGLSERQKILAEQGETLGRARMESELQALISYRDVLKRQISEASASATRAAQLRVDRRQQGEDLALKARLAQMQETLASVHSGFDPTDPASTIDEIRQRLNRPAPSTEDRVAEADRELEAERRRRTVDELLARYKSQPLDDPPATIEKKPNPPSAVDPPATSPARQADDEGGDPQPKTLGRNHGPLRPID